MSQRPALFHPDQGQGARRSQSAAARFADTTPAAASRGRGFRRPRSLSLQRRVFRCRLGVEIEPCDPLVGQRSAKMGTAPGSTPRPDPPGQHATCTRLEPVRPRLLDRCYVFNERSSRLTNSSAHPGQHGRHQRARGSREAAIARVRSVMQRAYPSQIAGTLDPHAPRPALHSRLARQGGYVLVGCSADPPVVTVVEQVNSLNRQRGPSRPKDRVQEPGRTAVSTNVSSQSGWLPVEGKTSSTALLEASKLHARDKAWFRSEVCRCFNHVIPIRRSCCCVMPSAAGQRT